jgi:hypothetical protein
MTWLPFRPLLDATIRARLMVALLPADRNAMSSIQPFFILPHRSHLMLIKLLEQ